MESRIRQLEDQLSKMTHESIKVPVQVPGPRTGTKASGIARASTILQNSHSFRQAKIVHHITYKTRLFGRSHWMNGAIQVSP